MRHLNSQLDILRGAELRSSHAGDGGPSLCSAILRAAEMIEGVVAELQLNQYSSSNLLGCLGTSAAVAA